MSIKNYRSISNATNLPISDLTTLVGANNEGKSNILRSIALSLSILSKGRSRPSSRARSSRYYYGEGNSSLDYKWIRDFPVALQAKSPDGRSEFILEFELNEEDFKDFKTIVGSNLQTNLRIKLSLGREEAKFEVMLKGKGKQFLTDRLPKIANFLAAKIQIQYIPAIRTDELAREAVDSLLNSELGRLEERIDYIELVDQIAALQQPILEELSKQISKTIKRFIPDVKSVRIETDSRIRSALRNAFSVHVNDGVDTELGLKGDGIKSLTAISLLRHVSQDALGKKFLVLAIEEPESHLHPQAVHKLREVLHEISAHHQVILTTHSPILVNRHSSKSNILVQDGNAECAKDFEVIRESLGVQLSDNLVSAKLILLVEGITDRDVLKAWLPSLSKIVDAALKRGDLIIQSLNGAGKLGYRLGIYQSLICNTHVYMDNDVPGRAAITNAKEKLLITDKEYNLTAVHSMKNSEFEDLIAPSSYLPKLNAEFGIDLKENDFKNIGKKWSDKMSSLFPNKTKIWDESTEKKVKILVAREAIRAGVTSLMPSAEDGLQVLALALEKRLTTP